MIYQIFLGLLSAILIALAAYKAHTLSKSGAVAAAVLGLVIFGFGGLGWAILLMGFFITSSALSRLLKGRKFTLDEKFSKGSVRDSGQVFANGGVAGVIVILYLLFPAAAPIWWLAFGGALAAANADTWATELGVLSRSGPRLITNFKAVERGTSGGISLAGTLAATGGAGVIAILGVLFRVGTLPQSGLGTLVLSLGIVTLAGLAGSLVDSLLGATLQAIYTCPQCHKETERHPLHLCGSPTTLLRGLPWMDNDLVNLICTLSGAVIAGLLGWLFFGV